MLCWDMLLKKPTQVSDLILVHLAQGAAYIMHLRCFPEPKLKMSYIHVHSFPCSYDTIKKCFPARLHSAAKTCMKTPWG